MDILQTDLSGDEREDLWRRANSRRGLPKAYALRLWDEMRKLEDALTGACESEMRLRQEKWNYERLAGEIIEHIEAGNLGRAVKMAHLITDGGDPGI